ncbi:MAG: DUF423 domain-containing protein [Porticoccaceae bacterium]|jgi:uncharacterized membrane protein YgdD (TMEM256/DUF423 family)|nr:DUF423 domain-containing protein [Porticoccaceae bacterium]
MDKLLWIRLTALSGAIAVMLGAFAAHSMKDTLTPQMLDIYQTAVLYQFIHTLALLSAINLPLNERSLHWAARSFMLGIVLFCGSLYLIAISGISVLGVVTPIGGSAFIVGWLLLFTATNAEE